MDAVKSLAAGLPLFLISLAVWTPLSRNYGVVAVYGVTFMTVALTVLLVRTEFVRRRSEWLVMSLFLGLLGGVGAAAGESDVIQGWDRLVWILIVAISFIVFGRLFDMLLGGKSGIED